MASNSIKVQYEVATSNDLGGRMRSWLERPQVEALKYEEVIIVLQTW